VSEENKIDEGGLRFSFFFVKFAKNLSCYDEKLQVRASSISINRQRRRRRAMGCTEPDKDIIEQILAGRQDL